jgi:chromosome segregation ATPase
MNRKSLIGLVVVGSLFSLFGCSGAPEDSGAVKKLEADLKKVKDQNWQLQKDNNDLSQSLKQAESSLFVTSDARNKLEDQVQKLTATRDDLVKSRDSLTARVDELSGARTELQARVDNLTQSRDSLQTTVADLTRSRDNLQTTVVSLTQSRDGLQKTVANLTESRNGLQKTVENVTQSRDGLQKTVDGLTVARVALEKQVAELTKARDIALEDARNAQVKIDQLNGKIKVQAQQMAELQSQMANIRALLERMQQNLQ